MRELEGLLRDNQKSKIRVALDVEGVIADITTPALKIYNQVHGTSYTVDDIKDWSFKSINAPIPEMMALFDRVWVEQSQNIKYEGDTNLIMALTKEYAVHIVTGRIGVDAQLKAWLSMAGLGSIPLITNPPIKEKTTLNYGIYIDDSPLLAKEVAETSRLPKGRMLLIDQPWNRDVAKHERILRVGDVNEALSVLLRASSMHRKIPNMAHGNLGPF